MAADTAGNLFFSVANGTFDTTLTPNGFPSQGNYGNAFVKVNGSNGPLQVADYWTMSDSVEESSQDEDLGSGGLMLLPDLIDALGNTRHLGTGAGKDRNVYVFDRDNMGRFDPDDDSTLYQELPGGLRGGEFGSPAWFNGTVYYGAVDDVIRAFRVDAALLTVTPSSTTSTVFGYPGATPAISARGAANGILWAVENANPAILHAYDASNLSIELYNSNQAGGARSVRTRQQIHHAHHCRRPGLCRHYEQRGCLWGFPAPPALSIPSGWVNLVSKISGQCLADPVSSLAPATILTQWPCNGYDDQKWQLTPVSGGYEITNAKSGLQMDVAGGTGSAQNGVPLIRWPYWGGANEVFQINPTSDGFYTLSPLHSGSCVDVPTWSETNGGQIPGLGIQQWTCWGGDMQKWSLIPAQ
jgi:hypothetical protein